MMTVSARQAAQQEVTPYAVVADFCRIFDQEMNRLYVLSFLLTADQRLAEECFARGLEDSTNSNRVFKEWADRWARRMIIQNAIQIIQPHPRENSTPRSRSDRGGAPGLGERSEIAAIVELPAFERFAFVISILEHCSDQDCSLLLGCTRSDLTAGRTRALQQITKSTELQHKTADSGAGKQTQTEDPGSVRQARVMSHLVAFA